MMMKMKIKMKKIINIDTRMKRKIVMEKKKLL